MASFEVYFVCSLCDLTLNAICSDVL